MKEFKELKTLADRMVWARQQKSERLNRDISQQAIADLAGVAQGTIGNLESGRGDSARKITSIAKALEVDPTWLESGKGDPHSPIVKIESIAHVERKHSNEFEIPQYDTGGSMGRGIILKDQPGIISGWNVTQEWLNKNVPDHTGIGNLAIVTGFGPSMRPLFNPGDPLLVDRGVTTAKRDAIYFFRVGDEGFIKHLQRVPGIGLVAISENKIYRDWTITEDMDFEVLALVIKVWCGTDF